MEWKELFQLTKSKIILTSVLLLLTEIALFWYGNNTSFIQCGIGKSCPDPNYGIIFVGVTILPLLGIYYLFSSVLESSNVIFPKFKGWKWVNLLSLFPFLFFYTKSCSSGLIYYIGFPRYLDINCCRSPCRVDFMFRSYESFFPVNFVLAIIIFTIISLVLYWIFKNQE